MLKDIVFGDIRHLIEFQRKIINLCADALMVVDRDGNIIYVNDSFKEVHEVTESDVLGQPVEKVINNTRLNVVAKTGIPELDNLQDINGHSYIVSRVPIFEDGICVGAVGVIRFRDTQEIAKLTEKVNDLKWELQRLRQSNKTGDGTEYTFDRIAGIAPAVQQAKQSAMLAAHSNATVLLRGESGVGKEVYSQSIHNYSERREEPFVQLNCSAITEHLIESELFGYEDGAFTGARKGGHRGLFEQAHKGTIFLDEIGDMPLSAQVKVLRVIQEGKVSRLGSEKLIDVDVRIIAATNRDLEQMINDGSFRKDLFYRLNVIAIELPPLRDAIEEIPVMAKSLWSKLTKKNGIYRKHLKKSALIALQQYSWPGNIRELQNFLERLMVMVIEEDITEEIVLNALKPLMTHNPSDAFEVNVAISLNEMVERTEQRAIKLALEYNPGNRSAAARQLGITRPLLYKKMARYGLS
ncbi:sigma-54 interaction domain-containing protein [Shewanella sp. GXUN23E]|uniref:sigma-54 interaction domain-containing protein n=1 Tax=Shewanella sp. GXUN23E TaxID=3422498 RepID=UPI003D7DB200